MQDSADKVFILCLCVQIHRLLASQCSSDQTDKKQDLLQKTADTLELILSRLSPSDNEVSFGT